MNHQPAPLNTVSGTTSQNHTCRPGVWKRFTEWFKDSTARLLHYLLQTLNRLDQKFTHYRYNPNPGFYDPLTPSKNLQEETTYTQAIEWALRNEEIKNIALTGPYGSGKSSILRSFENFNKQYKYLNISLATFDEEKDADAEQRRLVETSILQQIFYHVKDRQIPDSRFKRIKRLTALQQVLITVGFITWLLATLYIFRRDFFTRFSWLTKFEEVHRNQLNGILSAAFIVESAFGIFLLFRTFRNKKFSKLNLGTAEVELATDESSILNKYIDEILYFFESTSFDVVIIEDLDRFNDPEIFTKLREINTLINNSRQINRRVVFIYAVRDDMFLDKSRTKFFDFIIPVIPVINSSNSIDILLKKLADANLHETISPEFINDITLYIDDMRMLKNVINEYIIYKDKIGARLNQDRLLGMIIYKNLYPSDFAGLHIGKGKVYNIIANKENYIKSLIPGIDEQIRQKENLLGRVENETLRSIEELRGAYIIAIFQKFPASAELAIGVSHNKYNLAVATTDAVFKQISSAGNLQYLHYGLNNSGVSFSQIENAVDPSRTYQQREEEIKLKAGDKTNKLKQEIEQLKMEKNILREKSLSDILQDSNELVSSINEDKLLVYLLRYGYIEEQYFSYISYFYEGSITKEDNDFVLSVKNHEAKPFNFGLAKTAQLVKKMRIKEFSQEEILNYDLLSFLLENPGMYRSQLQRLLNQMTSQTRTGIDFMDGYIQEGAHPEKLVKQLAQQWSQFWIFVDFESGFPDEKKKQYLVILITHVQISILATLNGNGKLSAYIAAQKDFLLLFPEEALTEKLKLLIQKLDIKFINLTVSDNRRALFDFFYENNYYRINEAMIGQILSIRGTPPASDQLSTAHYTSVTMSGCSHLIQYLEDHIHTYVSNVLLTLPDNTKESQSSLVSLANNAGIPVEEKRQILSNQSYKIADVHSIETGFWDVLLEADVLKADWFNLVPIFALSQKVQRPLVEFLNRPDNFQALSLQPWPALTGESEEILSSFRDELVICNKLTDEGYEALISGIRVRYEEIDVAGLSMNKVDVLLKQDKVSLSPENFSTLKESFAPKHIELITKGPAEFIDHIAEYALDGPDYDALLNSAVFDTPKLQSLLESIDDRWMDEKTKLSETVFDLGLRSSIVLPTILLGKLFPLLSMKARIRILTAQMPHLIQDDITEYLKIMGEPFVLMTGTGRPAFDNTDLFKNFLSALEASKYISSWGHDENKIRAYPRNR